MLIRVFDHDAQAAFAHRVLRRAQDPNPGLIHRHPGINALSRTQHQYVDGRRRGHGISVQRDHVKFVAGSARCRFSIPLAFRK